MVTEMSKNTINLNENQLRNIIKESVHRMLNELDWKTYANAERKWADELGKNPAHPKRKSNIIGHQDSTGDHDIYTDNRLRGFQNARQDAFNRDYGYNVWASPENVANGVYKDVTKGSYQMDFPYQDTGMKGYYDRLHTETETPERDANGKSLPHHTMKDTFHLDSFDGTDKYPSKNHETKVSHVNGRYAPDTHVNRDAVEPQYDNIPYMKARNRGNKDIQDYQSGKSHYVKGEGWK